MTWNYRIVVHRGKHTTYGLHEVFYDDNGRPEGCSEPVDFVYDEDEGPDALIRDLECALKDVRNMPVLEASVFEKRGD